MVLAAAAIVIAQNVTVAANAKKTVLATAASNF